MLFTHLKTAFRSLVKQPSFTFINIAGLAIGLAGCLLILQYVSFELSYDRYHENSDDIFRVTYSKERNGVESFHTALTYAGVGLALKEQLPEVLEVARILPGSSGNVGSVIKVEEAIFRQDRMFYAEPTYLDMFDIKMLDGDKETALNAPFTAILTESTAKRYFGDQDPIGKRFIRGGNQNFEVTGVVADVPPNSHLKFDMLLSYQTYFSLRNGFSPNNMTVFHGHTYILTQPGTTAEQLSAKFPQFVNDNVWTVQNKADDTELYLYPMKLTDIHLNSNIQHEAEVNGDANTVKYLTIIAVMILLIAWVNYINLSTARSAQRAKEVGVRKVLGSQKRDLVWQFLVEAGLMNLLAMLVALGLVALSQRVFIQFGAADMLSVSLWFNPLFWQVVGLLWFTGMAFSGLYPAVAMSSFKPLAVLRGSFYGNRKGILLRKGLVIFQFTASIALLIGTAVVFLQIRHMRNIDLGVNIDQSVAISAPALADSTYVSRIRNFKTELLRNPLIDNVIATSDVPGREVSGATWYRKVEDQAGEGIFSHNTRVDENFVEGLNIEMLAGRNFVTEDNDRAILINQTAVEQFGYESPEKAISREITLNGRSGEFRMRIVGVIENYHQLSPKQAFEPLIVRYSPFARRYYVVKFNTGTDPGEAVSQVLKLSEEVYKGVFPGNPFSYFFIDQEFEKQYEGDQQFGDMFGIFSLLAIFVACLGLFGLAAHTVIQKTKEIGIRKVLGSSIANILKTLSWEYVKLIIVANLLAWPLIYYLMDQWLNTFVDRIGLSWWLFPAACLLVTFIAMFTVSFHTIRAARANPVKSLRYE